MKETKQINGYLSKRMRVFGLEELNISDLPI
jgi:hypothetical protein